MTYLPASADTTPELRELAERTARLVAIAIGHGNFAQAKAVIERAAEEAESNARRAKVRNAYSRSDVQ